MPKQDLNQLWHDLNIKEDNFVFLVESLTTKYNLSESDVASLHFAHSRAEMAETHYWVELEKQLTWIDKIRVYLKLRK